MTLGTQVDNLLLLRKKERDTYYVCLFIYLTHGNLLLQKPFLHFRARLNCDVEQNCLCHVVDHT